MIFDVAAHAKNFDRPDEVREFPGVVQNTVSLGDLLVARSTAVPGWRWRNDMQPIVGGEWCQARHVGTIVSGHFMFELSDGQQIPLGPGDVYDIPPDHDGWTVGDEPCTVVEWAGIRAFSGFRAGTVGRHLVTLLLTDLVDSTSIAERAHRDQLQIRAGVHVGEVEVVGRDIRGIAVHEAARIMGEAGPNEILLSETTYALSRAAELDFEDRGLHALRGIGETHLYAYCVTPA
jgi:hypothetical protein